MTADGSRQPPGSLRIVLRPIGSPLPLGFFAFGTGMALLGGIGLEWVPTSMQPQAGLVLLSFVGPLELLAAVLAYLARDAMAGTGLGLFAGSWLTLGAQYLVGPPGTPSPVVALYLFPFTVVILMLGVVARLGQPLLALILLTAAVRTGVAATWEVTALQSPPGADWLRVAAAVISLAITVLAFYGGLAFLMEDTAHRTVLPLARRGQSRTAIEGGLSGQTEGLAAEAGVRRSL